MKAAVIERQGDLEGLVYRDWPQPKPRAGEVLVRVRACGLNHLDIFVRRGMPDFPVPLPFISGGDIAGEIVAVGAKVSDELITRRVLVDPSTPDGMLGEQLPGGMAEFVTAPVSHILPLPSNVSFRQAACLPVAYGTARRMLLSRGKLRAGETVLILGASGGVGNACVQIARETGARVIATASDPAKLERLRKLGADDLINYQVEDFSAAAWRLTGKRGVDMVVNFTGGDTWVPSLRSLRDGGRLMTCGATAGFDPRTDIRYIWVRELNILGSDGWTTDDLRELLRQVASGTLRPVISDVLPLSSARAAERLLEARRVFGKVILEP